MPRKLFCIFGKASSRDEYSDIFVTQHRNEGLDGVRVRASAGPFNLNLDVRRLRPRSEDAITAILRRFSSGGELFYFRSQVVPVEVCWLALQRHSFHGKPLAFKGGDLSRVVCHQPESVDRKVL
jgi:hypothetical protein